MPVTLTEVQRIPTSGAGAAEPVPVAGFDLLAEDAEFFTIGDRSFLAVASIRAGAGPYDFHTTSWVFEWRGGRFLPFQDLPTFAAKRWKHWKATGRHFRGLAQRVSAPGVEGNQESVVCEWTGESFAEFQRISSRWALTPDLRFAAHTVRYELRAGAR
ncbi:MAG TPA: hypothetical protein VFE59_09990 [Trebonia sp.]|jgi:hypothetical protein|nr:hypothetical protein [Trebonia sp.]